MQDKTENNELTAADEPVLSNSDAAAEKSAPPEETAEKTADAENELTLLRGEVERLRAELQSVRKTEARVNADVEEFRRLFPNADLAGLPEEVTDGVRAGTPLSASYALYERRIAAERERAEAVNRQNAFRSSGAAGKNTSREYFTPDEVRAMSQSEVRDNYTKIVESMKRWNR